MSLMSKRKPKDEAASSRSPRPSRSGRNVNVWLRPDLGEALGAHLETARPRTSLTAVIEAALEEYLKSRGLWFPPGQSP
jgi:hypothetical protein